MGYLLAAIGGVILGVMVGMFWALMLGRAALRQQEKEPEKEEQHYWIVDGEEGLNIKSTKELSMEELRTLIEATNTFKDDLQKVVDSRSEAYHPTDTELARDAVAQEGAFSEDGGELGEADWENAVAAVWL